MEHTQKMYLVPQQQLAALQHHQSTDPQSVSLRQSVQNELDRAMSDILNQSDIDVYEKAKKYSSVLQKYLNLVKLGAREKNVLTLSLPHDASKGADTGVESQDIIVEDDIIRSEILAHMPPRNKRNAEYILTALFRNTDHISWTNNGEIVVEDKTVTGSHLYDLLKSVTTPNNVSDLSRPAGWNVFLKTLALLNIPLSVIPNTTVRRAVTGFKTLSPVAANSHHTVTDARSPDMFRHRAARLDAPLRQHSLTGTSTPLIPRTVRLASPLTSTRWTSF